MKKNNKFKTQSPPKDIKFVQNKGYNNSSPVFSFAKYIENPNYFSKEHSKEERNLLYNFLRNLREFSQFTWGQIKQDPKTFHFHEVEKDISILKDYEGIDLSQFKIPGQKQGRFVGFLDANNVFNILIYDSQHSIYLRK